VSSSRFDRWVRAVGTDPDPRFTLANERTFLAWMRTTLGLVGIGLGVGALLPGPSTPLRLLGAAWVVLGVALAGRSLVRWYVVERAMRQGQAFPLSRSIPVAAVGLGVLAVATVVVMAQL
jgi:putative membrane protein